MCCHNDHQTTFKRIKMTLYAVYTNGISPSVTVRWQTDGRTSDSKTTTTTTKFIPSYSKWNILKNRSREKPIIVYQNITHVHTYFFFQTISNNCKMIPRSLIFSYILNIDFPLHVQHPIPLKIFLFFEDKIQTIKDQISHTAFNHYITNVTVFFHFLINFQPCKSSTHFMSVLKYYYPSV